MQSPSQVEQSFEPTSVVYDAEEIFDCSRRLYGRANAIIRSMTTLGVLFGGIGGGVIGYFIADGNGGAAFVVALIGAVVGGFAGNEEGKNRVVLLKLQAENTLCRLQTAINTEPK